MSQEPQILDTSKLVEIYDGDQSIINDMLIIFEEGMIESMNSLKEAIDNNDDSDKIRFFAHRIRGSSAEFGATQLCEITKQMEELCISEEFDKVIALYPSAYEAAQKIVAHIATLSS